MKKATFSLVLLLVTLSASALTRFYCGKHGNLFEINWFYNIKGELDYRIVHIGDCMGGPWTVQGLALSPQEADILGGVQEASADIYRSLATFHLNPEPNSEIESDIAEASNVISPNNSITYVNPHFVDKMWAKVLASREGKSIFALTLKEHPFRGVMRFEIWSTKDQAVRVSLREVNTGQEIYTTSISIVEGLNRNEVLTIPARLRGNHLLILESPENTVSRTVMLD